MGLLKPIALELLRDEQVGSRKTVAWPLHSGTSSSYQMVDGPLSPSVPSPEPDRRPQLAERVHGVVGREGEGLEQTWEWEWTWADNAPWWSRQSAWHTGRGWSPAESGIPMIGQTLQDGVHGGEHGNEPPSPAIHISTAFFHSRYDSVGKAAKEAG